MARTQRVFGEKPLLWMGSSKDDLLEFPEAVKDEIGTALSVAQFAASTPAQSRGRAKGRASWSLSRTTGATPIGLCIR